MGYIGKSPEHGRFAKVDQINSGFNGSATTFNLTVDSVAIYPTNPQNLLISIGGVLQQPGTDYTVSAATLTLTSAPAASTDFFGVLLGDVLDIGTPSDGSVTVSKMAVNSIDSDQYVDGSIDTVHIGDNQVTGTKIAMGSDAQGDILYYDGTNYIRLAKGTADQILTMNDGATAPGWETAVSGPSQASQSAIEAETNQDTYVPPDLLKHSPGVAKAWGSITSAGALESPDYGISSVTDSSAGNRIIIWTTAFSSGDYAIGASSDGGGTADVQVFYYHESGRQTTQVTAIAYVGTTPTDRPHSFVVFGDQ